MTDKSLLRGLYCLLCLSLVTPALAEPPEVELDTPLIDEVGETEATEPTDDLAPVEKKSHTRYIQLIRDEEGQPTAMQTAVVRFVPKSGEGDLEVDLVSVIHIGDKAYYQALDERFEEYDVVLYELVAPKGTRIERNRRRTSPMPALIKMGLDLETQVERIEYTKENFVHADMSPSEMSEAMKRRGEDAVTLTLGIVTDMLRQYNRNKIAEEEAQENGEDVVRPAPPELNLADILFDPNGPVKLKRAMAEQFDVEDPSAGLGQTLNTLLIADRNAACVKVFQQELAKGHKKIAIFYGAAHMPDFERRLTEEFDLKRDKVEWFTAWDMEE